MPFPHCPQVDRISARILPRRDIPRLPPTDRAGGSQEPAASRSSCRTGHRSKAPSGSSPGPAGRASLGPPRPSAAGTSEAPRVAAGLRWFPSSVRLTIYGSVPLPTGRNDRSMVARSSRGRGSRRGGIDPTSRQVVFRAILRRTCRHALALPGRVPRQASASQASAQTSSRLGNKNEHLPQTLAK